MSLRNWTMKWLTAAIACVLLILGSGWIWLQHSTHSDTRSADRDRVVHHARLQINGLMLYLEQNSERLTDDESIREELAQLSRERQITMTYTALDGTVIFSTDSPAKQLSARTTYDMSYGLYPAGQDNRSYTIAFPVISQSSRSQIGNASFTLSEHQLFTEAPSRIPSYCFAAMTAAMLVLLALLVGMRFKLARHVISPVSLLGHQAEAILEGRYDVQCSYSRMDELGELCAKFDQMRAEIQHLDSTRHSRDKTQKELISNLSHDIKTPLATVNAYLEAIQEGVCPDEATLLEYISIMQTHTNRIARLIDDLLLHALQDLGEISFQPREQYSKPLLEAIIRPLEHDVRTNGVLFEAPAALPNVLIRVDAVRLEQVIANLVSNAIKHTKHGDVIRMDARLADGQLHLEIADNGAGIRPQDMPFIFERSFRGAAQMPNEFIQTSGTGLGLSICKTIMEAHNGSIAFNSKAGSGTAFHLYLPLC